MFCRTQWGGREEKKRELGDRKKKLQEEMNSWGLDHFAGRIVDWFYLHLSKGDMQTLEVRGHLGVSSFLPGDWTQACCWAPSTSESLHHPELGILKSVPAAEENEKLITVDYNHADFNCMRFLTLAHQNDNKMWLQVPRGSGWLQRPFRCVLGVGIQMVPKAAFPDQQAQGEWHTVSSAPEDLLSP